MATIVTRAGKGSTLTFTEQDANTTNLNAGLPETMVTAKGDMIGATASGAVDNFAVGTNGKVLTADSTAAVGVSWQTPAATAGAITFTPAGDIIATNVQDAIVEVDTELHDHLTDTAGAHAASAISFTPTGTVSATDVQAAIAEVAAEASATTVATDAIWDAKGDLVVATAANTAVRLAVGTDGYVLTANSAATEGVNWVEPGTTSAPTVQTFTSGSGTYTKPAGCTRIIVEMVGAGGGGSGSGTVTGTAAGTGGSTTFGTSLLTCVGGTLAAFDGAGGAGGTATIAAPAIGVALPGGMGVSSTRQGATVTAATPSIQGGSGGNSAFGGGGTGGVVSGAGTGFAGSTNTGGGGGGGYAGAVNAKISGAGGGAGGYIKATISAPTATYDYAVGTAGTAGGAGTSGYAGGAGAAGYIQVTEYYGNFDSVLQLNEPASTKQEFTSGSGTYTTPAGVNRIRVKMVGGGGGGSGSGTAAGTAAGDGGTSTFGSSLLTTIGGTKGTFGATGGASGGTATVSSPAVGAAITGGPGSTYSHQVTINAGAYLTGGNGGNAPYFGGGGAASGGNSIVAGGAGVTNTGGGGAGAGGTNLSAGFSGNGGGSGGFVDAWIWSPSATYAYAVGASGTAGGAGTSGQAGGAGAAGRIIVEEFYGPTNTVADTQPLSGWPGRNRIINGHFIFDQWRDAIATAATAGGLYICDRWLCLEDSDGGFTVQQVATTPPAGFTHYAHVVVTSADASLSAAQACLIAQRIEGFNVADLDWGLSTAKTVTLSFWVRSSLTGTFSGSVKNSASNRSYPFSYTISSAATWERKTVVIPGDTTGTWLKDSSIGLSLTFSLGHGSTYLGPAGAWAATGYNGVTGETPVIGTNGATWDITGVQLEPGSVRTEYERKKHSDVLIECQRYFYKIFPALGSAVFNVGMTDTTTISYATYHHPVLMRSAPTIWVTATATDYHIFDTTGGNIACSVVPSILSNLTNKASTVQFTVAAGLTAGRGNLQRTNSVNGYLGFSAEV